MSCISRLLHLKWNGARITFAFLQCPLCRQDIESESLIQVLEPLHALRALVGEKALKRLAHEGKDNDEAVMSGNWAGNREGYAMHVYAYYQCFKCAEPYFGGNNECAAQ